MHNTDVITLPRLVARLPRVLANLPGLIKGARMSKITDTRTPVGLARGFQLAVNNNPEGVALMFEDQRFSYRELNAWANRVAHALAARGLRKGDTVAVAIENRPELIATVLGCAKQGICVALLNTSQREKVLIHSINLVEPKAIIVGEEMHQAVEAVRSELSLERGGFLFWADRNTREEAGVAPPGYVNLAEALRDMSDHDPDAVNRIVLRDPLFYIYTSGTTGMPKAVIFNNGRWWKAYGGLGHAAVGLSKDDRMYCTLPLYHATGMVACWSAIICASAALVLARRFSTSRFWDDVRRYECTSFGYVGELCRYLHDAPRRPGDANNPVRIIVGNGLRPGIWRAFKDRFGIERVVEIYGSSEGNVAFANIFGFDNTVGFSTVSYAIVEYDKDADKPVRGADGFMKKVKKGEAGLMIGEITAKTPFDGYTDQDKTEKSIFRDVFRKGDAWFNSGDMMRDIGYRHAQFVDRLGDTFRWKGENVSTTEVEQIIDQYPDVQESVVYGVEIPDTNGRAGMARLCLKVSLAAFDFEAFVNHLYRYLPIYAVPVFLRISYDAVETTGTFKYQKNRLKEEGYDLSRQDNPLYVLLPGQIDYQPLTAELAAEINGGEHRF
ncbi:long-chain-acyl-CoA synthetase [Isoalcanivorax indicus]|uniref:long-chain-acyl-CoA synthetase n=1 Tax=Isoalcanivorax indicus TaxID=2202653 RepID=UPI000DB96CF9|nr:long-chain-acyl-CoA synthetase [Isoalcanivorax indicus]